MALLVRLDRENVPTVKFSKIKSQKLLCELTLIKICKASVVQMFFVMTILDMHSNQCSF